MNHKILRKIIREQIEENYRLLIVKAGTELFHASGEEINGDLRGGGYDRVFWTTRDSGLSQTYIPVSSKIHTSTRLIARPSKSPDIINIQKKFGIDFGDVQWEGNTYKSYKTPEPFIGHYDESKKVMNQMIQKEDEEKEMMKRAIDEKSLDLESRKELIKSISELRKEIEELKKEYFRTKPEKLQNEFVNQKLFEMGYEPTMKSDYDGDHSWALKTSIDKILPADYRHKGTLFIVKPKRDLKIYDYAKDSEGDLTDLDYHKLNIFEMAEEAGYDGIQINDFAQVESEGNFGHRSIGLFKNTMKAVDVEKIEGAEHPDEKEIERMMSSRDWRSKEYLAARK